MSVADLAYCRERVEPSFKRYYASEGIDGTPVEVLRCANCDDVLEFMGYGLEPLVSELPDSGSCVLETMDIFIDVIALKCKKCGTKYKICVSNAYDKFEKTLEHLDREVNRLRGRLDQIQTVLNRSDLSDTQKVLTTAIILNDEEK